MNNFTFKKIYVIGRFNIRARVLAWLGAIDRENAEDFAKRFLTSNGKAAYVVMESDTHIPVMNIQYSPGQVVLAAAPWVKNFRAGEIFATNNDADGPAEPHAKAVDLEQFREAVEHWHRALASDYAGGHIEDGGVAMAEADRLLALIDGKAVQS